MPNEIQVFYDNLLTKEVSSEITFEPLDAGKTHQKSLFLKNSIEFVATLKINLEGSDAIIVNKINSLKPNEVGELIISITPKLTTMKPIKLKLKIEVSYLVE